MPKKQNTTDWSITAYPEEISKDSGIKVFGLESYHNWIANLSHLLQESGDGLTTDKNNEHKAKMIQQVREYVSIKDPTRDYTDDEIVCVAENPSSYGIFDDFFNVPFRSPMQYEHTVVDLFAGIGGIRIPFDEMGYKCVFSSEWDKKACKTYFANFGVMPYGDITKIPSHRIPRHDVLLAGFPCQAFSIMGKMNGFADTRGTMFFEIERILDYHRTPYIILENVKQLVNHDKGRTFKVILERLAQLGYHVKWQVLNALDFGLPQKRERVIIVGFQSKEDCEAFSFEIPHIKYDLSSILEPDESVDQSLFASKHIIERRKLKTEGKAVFYPSIWHENKSGNISILDYSCALRTGASYNYLLVNGVRRPSSRELLRLQGFPEKFRIVVSHQDIRHQTGNSVAIPMIRMVAQNINKIISNHQYEASKTPRQQHKDILMCPRRPLSSPSNVRPC